MNNISVEEMRKLINLIADDTLEAIYIDKDMLNNLNHYYMSLIDYNNVLKQRIDKAIEYTEKHIGIRIGDDFIPTNKELLDILRGEDNE